MSEQTSAGRPRRRSLAILLSLGLPGLGELYAGRPRAGIATFALLCLCAAVTIALVFVPLTGPAVLILSFGIPLGAWIFVLVRAARAARQAPDPYPLQPYNRWYWYVLAVLISVLVWQPTVTRVLRSRWIEAFRIPSPSMEPTIYRGDYIFASKRPSARIPQQNGLAIVAAATDERILSVKRVVGFPGDTLAMADGELIRNGRSVAEPYAQSVDPGRAPKLSDGRRWQLAHLVNRSLSTQRLYDPDTRNWGPLVVPADSVFVLGDNRDNSYDSRFYGAVGIDRLRGKPLAIYFSVRDSHVRWSRIGLRF